MIRPSRNQDTFALGRAFTLQTFSEHLALTKNLASTKKLACQAIFIENHLLKSYGLVREPVKNYLADFVYEGGGTPPVR